MGLVPKLWGHGECQCVGAAGSVGGVACLWNPLRLHLVWWAMSRSSTSEVLSSLEIGEVVLFSNIYAPIDLPCKHNLWSHVAGMRRLAPFHPWIMAADFNAILELSEKKGGVVRLEPSSVLFQDSISRLQLVDIKPSNGVFTWNNRRVGENWIAEWLDRFLWNRQGFGNIFREKKAAQIVLSEITREIREHGLSKDFLREEDKAVKVVEEWETREEVYWKQRARIDWLKEGDKNMTFFFNSVKARRHENSIPILVNDRGEQCLSLEEMSREALQFFQSLFKEESQGETEEENLVLACIHSLVSREMNEQLLGPILMEELERIVFHMRKGKALGPDGFLIEFFQEF
ncbi:uncharacterized protein LOC131876138 [Cryptomeria japonica]|uniref:uncharacterized protein LOC131876138 n=1 Tax=Cryptomeria japonica TaxID=3369 RepID=UPI0027DA3123|nr:uncharacterized protein LOC131876138 [Cryptomeria japonica]